MAVRQKGGGWWDVWDSGRTARMHCPQRAQIARATLGRCGKLSTVVVAPWLPVCGTEMGLQYELQRAGKVRGTTLFQELREIPTLSAAVLPLPCRIYPNGPHITCRGITHHSGRAERCPDPARRDLRRPSRNCAPRLRHIEIGAAKLVATCPWGGTNTARFAAPISHHPCHTAVTPAPSNAGESATTIQ